MDHTLFCGVINHYEFEMIRGKCWNRTNMFI